MTTLEAVPFDKTATSAPDRHGNPTELGDYVKANDGGVWKVRGLRLTEEHAPGSLRDKLGTLSMDFSYFEVEQHTPVREWTPGGLPMGGVTQWSVALRDAERLDLTPEQRLELEVAAVDQAITNVDVQVAALQARKRQLETKRLMLLRGGSS